MAEKKQKPTCKACKYMEPELTRNGRNIFYCTHAEAKTETLPHRIITRSRKEEIPTKTAPRWCPLTPEDHPSKNHCKNCYYAERYGASDGFRCRAKHQDIKEEQRGCSFFRQKED